MPAVDPANQWLTDEPTLVDGKTWYGPMAVPDDQLGFEEIFARGLAGPYYKQKVYGFLPGDNSSSRPNMENLPYYEFVVVGKLRAGGLWLVLGSDQLGLQLDADFKSGDGAIGTAGHDFAFAINSVNKAIILPSFLGSNTTPPMPSNQTEIIYFTNQTAVNIAWTGTRISKFGEFPEIEVWFNNDSGGATIAWTEIQVDVPAPNQTAFTVYNGSVQSGFIVLK